MDMSAGISNLIPIVLELKRWFGHVQRLKEENFYSTEVRDLTVPSHARGRSHGRSAKGSHTDPDRPGTGEVGARFSRNVPLELVRPEQGSESSPSPLYDPDPRLVSRELLHRKGGKFIPATQVNLLAAAWIQFQVHDWFGHDDRGQDFDLPHDPELPELKLRRTVEDRRDRRGKVPGKRAPSHSSYRPHPDVPAYVNTQSHWWDASQIYGPNPNALRDGSKAELKLERAGAMGELMLPYSNDPRRPDRSGFTDNWWVGLSILHTLFALEHNAICHALRIGEPRFQGGGHEDEIFECARLVNGALMAKIHTTEWTPAMLHDRPIQIALLADWWGIEDTELLECAELLFGHLRKLGNLTVEEAFRELMTPAHQSTQELLGQLHRKVRDGNVDEFLQGLADVVRGHAPKRRTHTRLEPFGCPPYRNNPPYAMTEEFTAIYRMHQLAPDEIRILPIGGAADSTVDRSKPVPFLECIREQARELVKEHGLAKLFYSFGNTHPGALVLDNFPVTLPKLTDKTDVVGLDLAAVDILRDRERGVPRYTEFRRQIRGDTIVTFEGLTGANEPGLSEDEYARRMAFAGRIRKVYKKGDKMTDKEAVDRVDLQIGLCAEPFPKGFAFSSTTFHLFALMAPLRLRSDPFYTTNYGEEYYTRTGLEWINENTMKTVLARHFEGELAGSLMAIRNAFEPWSAPGNSDVGGRGPAAA